MSDFDKEAEREKLRQQYENEKEERKSTQRMSELLLQGATMTGKHCDTCGDPIFRYDGNEFCATCQHADSETESRTGADASEETAAGETTANQTTGEPSAQTTPQNGSEIKVESADSDQSPHQQAQRGSQPPHPTPQQTPPRQSRRTPPSQTSGNEHVGRARQPEPPTSATSEAGDLTEARNALVRKLTSLTQEAESTNDVGYSRELLAATREAAEALAALDRANR